MHNYSKYIYMLICARICEDFNVTLGRRPMRALLSFTTLATLDNQGVQPVTALAQLAWLLSTRGNEITMTWSPVKMEVEMEVEKWEGATIMMDIVQRGHSTCAVLAWLGPGCHHRPPGQLRDHKGDTGDLF